MSDLLSERLRSARDLRALSQSDVASRAGLQPSHISHFEAGRRTPSVDNLHRLADALRVSTDYLLGREDRLAIQGESVRRLFKAAARISETDLELLVSMAKVLAQRSRSTGRL